MLNRRDFLKLVGVGGAGAAAGFALRESAKNPPAQLIPYLVPPEEIIPGVANWYASVCTQCSAGCGMNTIRDRLSPAQLLLTRATGAKSAMETS